jgi:hypothetical protein
VEGNLRFPLDFTYHGCPLFVIEERINGTMAIAHDDTLLKFKEITERPERQKTKPRLCRKKRQCKPSADHPWRKNLRLTDGRQTNGHGLHK